MYNFFNLDLFNEKNEVESATGLLYGCYFMLHIMPVTSQLGVIFSWELIIKAFGGIALACITAAGLNLAKRWSNDYYDKVSIRWFKKIKKTADTTEEKEEIY